MTRETIRVVSALIRHPSEARRGELLMGLRGPGRARPDLWEFPGGKVKEGETLAAALARELGEEIPELGEVVVGDLVATGIVRADIVVLIYAFEVRCPGLDAERADRIGSTVHSDVDFVAPGRAVVAMPCSPGFYEHYEFIDLWLSDSSARSSVGLAVALPRADPTIGGRGEVMHCVDGVYRIVEADCALGFAVEPARDGSPGRSVVYEIHASSSRDLRRQLDAFVAGAALGCDPDARDEWGVLLPPRGRTPFWLFSGVLWISLAVLVVVLTAVLVRSMVVSW